MNCEDSYKYQIRKDAEVLVDKYYPSILLSKIVWSRFEPGAVWLHGVHLLSTKESDIYKYL
jgi:hypothetical protein